MSNRIYIVGCAKSGNTLLYRLFTSFKGIMPIKGEQDPSQIGPIIETSPDVSIVAKRGKYAPFSNFRTFAECRDFLDSVKGIMHTVVIYRDGRDVIESDNGAVSGMRWVYSIHQMVEFRDQLSAMVQYEDLVTNPDEVQKRLATRLGLEIEHKFSEYPNFVRPDLFPLGGKYKARPISTASIGKNPDLWKVKCKYCYHAFQDCLEALGYET